MVNVDCLGGVARLGIREYNDVRRKGAKQHFLEKPDSAS